MYAFSVDALASYFTKKRKQNRDITTKKRLSFFYPPPNLHPDSTSLFVFVFEETQAHFPVGPILPFIKRNEQVLI